MIEHTRTPTFPQFEFEYHPETGKVYRVDVPGQWIDGEFVRDPDRRVAEGVCIAEHCDHSARFYGFVQTYLRGYRRGASDARSNQCPQ